MSYVDEAAGHAREVQGHDGGGGGGTATAHGFGPPQDPINESFLVSYASTVPTSGYFTLSHGGQTTAHVPWNATLAAICSALEALPSIGTGNLSVIGERAGDPPATALLSGPDQYGSFMFTGARALSAQDDPTVAVDALVGGPVTVSNYNAFTVGAPAGAAVGSFYMDDDAQELWFLVGIGPAIAWVRVPTRYAPYSIVTGPIDRVNQTRPAELQLSPPYPGPPIAGGSAFLMAGQGGPDHIGGDVSVSGGPGGGNDPGTVAARGGHGTDHGSVDLYTRGSWGAPGQVVFRDRMTTGLGYVDILTTRAGPPLGGSNPVSNDFVSPFILDTTPVTGGLYAWTPTGYLKVAAAM